MRLLRVINLAFAVLAMVAPLELLNEFVLGGSGWLAAEPTGAAVFLGLSARCSIVIARGYDHRPAVSRERR